MARFIELDCMEFYDEHGGVYRRRGSVTINVEAIASVKSEGAVTTLRLIGGSVHTVLQSDELKAALHNPIQTFDPVADQITDLYQLFRKLNARVDQLERDCAGADLTDDPADVGLPHFYEGNSSGTPPAQMLIELDNQFFHIKAMMESYYRNVIQREIAGAANEDSADGSPL